MSGSTSQTSNNPSWRGRRPAKPKAGIPQLNCELCRERKIKCDKSSPCSNCVKASVACVPIYRKRLPRGRHTHRQSPAAADDGDELRDRIRRLETLVSNMSDSLNTPPVNTSLMPSKLAPTTPISPQSVDMGPEKQVGQQFWAHIAEEIDGLRGVVGSPSDDEESVRSNPKSTSSAGVRIIGIGSSHVGGLQVTDGCLRDTQMAAQLCQVYLRQVDPVIKVLHRPSLSKFMLNGQPYLGYEPDHASTTCLRSAVCYSALASMTEEQCQNLLSTSKPMIVAEYRAACEAALESSDLLITSDITVLQAFILYLVARRTEDSSRAVWTMIAVAVRIAKALSLHLERSDSFFNRQIKKRLWYTICLLDLQASFEQASEPLIELDIESSILPRNINDSEFDVDTSGEVQSRDGLTDMTFALITYDAQLSGRLLNFPGKGIDTFNWEEREKQVSRFEQNALNLLKFCDPESSAYAWFTFHGTQSLVASMRLAALRPLHLVGSKPIPRAQQFTDLLNVALKVLDKVHLIRTNPRGECFRWYVVVQWHALAIAITECYVCTDVRILRTAWPVVEAAFEHHKTIIESYRRGMLKQPLERLMRQARKRVSLLLRGQNPLQRPSQPDVGLWASLSADQPGCHSFTRPSSTTVTDMESPNPPDLPLAQQHPQQPITPLDFDFGGVSPLLPFDNSIITPSSMPPWFTSQMTFGQNSDMSSICELNSGAAGDASWKTWEEFVSGLSFDDFSQVTT
ncbi:hypothetical protein F4677DRAFT_452692 [Hypoxylon crocopeplum]|nr:hypothetical protein F4677DRAFT_452692 [Hypoxylon crocopeplum]